MRSLFCSNTKFLVLSLVLWLLAACSHHQIKHNARLSDPNLVRTQLNEQFKQWQGTPYRYGGMSHRGIDCSGFVYRTFSERFNLQLPRSTSQQSKIGHEIDADALSPGDLVFFKTGRGTGGMHVGIYDSNGLFIHASTSRGVIRSSLNNVYWRKVYWQARRL